MTQDDDAVISLEGWRLKKRQDGAKTCAHPRTIVDETHGTVECRDCHAPLSAFWVLGQIAREENRCLENVRSVRREAAELQTWVPFLRAMRGLERRWRGRKTLPACPHCRRGLWPDEMQRFTVSTDLEIAHRKRAGREVPPGARVE